MKKMIMFAAVCFSILVGSYVAIAGPINQCPAGIKIDDGKACTLDECTMLKGRPKVTHALACPAGAACNAKGVCEKIDPNAACKGVNIDDGKACTAGTCKVVNGKPVVTQKEACPEGATCNAQGNCEAPDKCANNPDVDDGKECTVDTCDPYTGAVWHASNCTNNTKCTKNGCQTPICGDGEIDKWELCDGDPGFSCVDMNTIIAFEFGTSPQYSGGNHKCNEYCLFDTSDCIKSQDGDIQPGEFKVSKTCGNGQIEAGEFCDGNNLNDLACQGLAVSFGTKYRGGNLKCNAACLLDTSECLDNKTGKKSTKCGNGEIDSWELCDGNSFAIKTCGSFNFSGGNLKCDETCQIDTSNCVK